MDSDTLEGRELDEAVASVRGWKYIQPLREYFPPAGVSGLMPEWATDITSAWKLVEEMCAMGYSVKVGGDWNGLWSCSVHRNDLYGTLVVEQIYETAPKAICRTYLKVKEAQ